MSWQMIKQLTNGLSTMLPCIEIVVDFQTVFGKVQKEMLMIKIAVTSILVVIVLLKDCLHATVSNSADSNVLG